MIVGLTLVAYEGDHAFDLLVTRIGAQDAAQHAAGLAEEHVSPAHEALGTRLVQDDARVNGRGDLERHTRVDVGLDEARHDVGGGALRGKDEVDARSAREPGRCARSRPLRPFRQPS